MNYYPFHIGDYLTHTAHLTPIEDIAYRRLLDLYYQTETALSGDVPRLCRLIRMREYEQEVAAVLDEFFVGQGERWCNARCDAELLRMIDKQAKAKASAEASVNARRTKAQQAQAVVRPGVERTLSEPSSERLSEGSTAAELPTPQPRSTPTPLPQWDSHAQSSASPSAVGQASQTMRAAGLQDANPGHPLLAKLLAEGISLQELAFAASESVRRGKGFAYALTMAAGRRDDAAQRKSASAVAKRGPVLDQFDAKDYGTRVSLV